jgi:anti-anti-sigma regulatory factor
MNSTPLPPDAGDAALAVHLPVHGTTVCAEELRTNLVFAAAFKPATIIDAAGVESIGQAVLQLLVAACAGARRDNRPFSIINPSVAFIDRIDRCCLAEAVGLDSGKGISR